MVGRWPWEERNRRVEEEFLKVEADPSSNGHESGLLYSGSLVDSFSSTFINLGHGVEGRQIYTQHKHPSIHHPSIPFSNTRRIMLTLHMVGQ